MRFLQEYQQIGHKAFWLFQDEQNFCAGMLWISKTYYNVHLQLTTWLQNRFGWLCIHRIEDYGLFQKLETILYSKKEKSHFEVGEIQDVVMFVEPTWV